MTSHRGNRGPLPPAKFSHGDIVEVVPSGKLPGPSRRHGVVEGFERSGYIWLYLVNLEDGKTLKFYEYELKFFPAPKPPQPVTIHQKPLQIVAGEVSRAPDLMPQLEINIEKGKRFKVIDDVRLVLGKRGKYERSNRYIEVSSDEENQIYAPSTQGDLPDLSYDKPAILNASQAEVFPPDSRSSEVWAKVAKERVDDLASIAPVPAMVDSDDEPAILHKSQAGVFPPDSRSSEAWAEVDTERDDDLASIFSVSSFADSGYGSLNERPEQKDGARELTSMLLDDEKLQDLLKVLFLRFPRHETFVARFRSLLKTYGRDLMEEAQNGAQRAAAEMVEAGATRVARDIKTLYFTGDLPWVRADDARRARVDAILEMRLARTTATARPQDTARPDADGSFDDDDDSKASSGDENNINVSLHKVKAFMTSSLAFTRLRTSFNRMVYPDPCAGIVDLMGSVYGTSQESKCYARFDLHWELAQFLDIEVGYKDPFKQRHDTLQNVLVVNGTRNKAFASTAASYVRWRWPNFKVNLLQLIENELKGQSGPSEELGGIEFKICIDDGSSYVTMTATQNELLHVAQQLAWITASFRLPKYGQLSYSEAFIERTGKEHFSIQLLELEVVRPNQSACWLPLFQNSIIVRGFTVPPRNGEKGVEIPFLVMTSLAKIMYPVFHEQGFYLRAFSKLLFPSAMSPDMSFVQWHLMTGANGHKRLPPGTLPEETTDCQWLKSHDLELLASAKRTFVGYCREIEVHLGTELPRGAYTSVSSCGADDEDPAPGLAPKSVTTGTSGLGFWGVQATADVILPKALFARVQPEGYLDLMDHAKDAPIVLYDNAENRKRAFLVPTLSAILHMAHIWAQDKDLLTPLPFANAHWDSGQAAYDVIKRNSRLELRDGLKDDKKETLSDLIGRLLVTLDQLREKEALAKSDPGRAAKAECSKLYGWDLSSVARGKREMVRKQIRLNEEWTTLSSDALVLMCKNIGDVIRPASNVMICPQVTLAHERSNVLMATAKCLLDLAEARDEPQGSSYLRLTNKAYWLAPTSDQFSDCVDCLNPDQGVRTNCPKRPQRILLDKPPSHSISLTFPIEGAVIFGSERRQRGRKLVKERKSNQIAPHETQVRGGTFPDPGSEADDEAFDIVDTPQMRPEEEARGEASSSDQNRTQGTSATSGSQQATQASSGTDTPISSQVSPATLTTEPKKLTINSHVDEMGRLQVIGAQVRRLKNRLINGKGERSRRPLN